MSVIGLLTLLVAPAGAQAPEDPYTGDCHLLPRDEWPGSETILELDNVRAKITNLGNLFWNGGQPVYEIPKGSDNHTEFVMNFIVGGLVDADARVAGSSYGPFEFWPGPLNEQGFSSEDCHKYDRLWTIDREADLSGSEGSGPPTDRVMDWPVELGAPFIDNNGNGVYEPELGDRPRMLGDQMVWWVMNDRGGEHMRYDSRPLGVEVRGTAYGFNDAGMISNTTFYRYEITNRNEAPIDGLFVAWYRDFDLGAAFDDYVGSDTTLGLAYAYNADNHDDGNYGEAPPAAGFMILQSNNCTEDYFRMGLKSEVGCWTNEMSMHRSFFDCCGPGSEPQNGEQWLRYLNGLWGDGSTLSSSRYFGVPPDREHERFMYPGDPVTGEFWSEVNIDGNGMSRSPADRKSIGGSRGDTLQPGETVVITFALVWARGTSNLDSITQLRRATRAVRESSDLWVAPFERTEPPVEEPEPEYPLGAAIYPNPAAGEAALQLGLPQSMDVRIDVFDALGRRVDEVVDAHLDAGDRTWTLPTADWPPGVYVVRLQVDHITETRRLVVVR